MKPAVKELVQLLENTEVLITYKKLPGERILEKYFVKATDHFCDEELCCLRLISCAEEKEEVLHESQIFGFRTFGEGHDFSRVFSSEETKLEFQTYKAKAASFDSFDEAYFDPKVDRQKLKVCVILELSSLEELNDDSVEALQKLKDFWKRQIDIHKEQTVKYINSELSGNNTFDSETVEEIKQLVLNYDPTTELSEIKTKTELFEYWPTLLLPAPDFINEIFVDLFRNG